MQTETRFSLFFRYLENYKEVLKLQTCFFSVKNVLLTSPLLVSIYTTKYFCKLFMLCWWKQNTIQYFKDMQTLQDLVAKTTFKIWRTFDVYLLVTKNLNPFSLDRKLAEKNKQEMIYILWKECMPQKFERHICK